ncbi:MAG: helix-turn-helix transcriptional regulator [Clostridia bacterium]|nr:helix-turn-helix transcriptional regulator [Clostridia bacterium]
MAVSYNKLWKLLIDKKMSKADLRRAAKVAPNTMTKLSRDEEVSIAVLERICGILGANIGDVMDFVPDEENN